MKKRRIVTLPWRRQFSSYEERRILIAANRCTEAGEIGTLCPRTKRGREILRGAVNSLARDVGMARACGALCVNRSGVYR